MLLEDDLYILGLVVDLPFIISEDKILRQEASQRLCIALLISFASLPFERKDFCFIFCRMIFLSRRLSEGKRSRKDC